MNPHRPVRGPLHAALVALTLTSFACASAGAGGSQRSGNTLTREEVLAASVQTAYDAVARLRPQWLQSRGPMSVRSGGSAAPAVFMDGQQYGSLDALRDIRSTDVESIEFIGAADATTRYGTGYPAGIIMVRSQH